MISASLFVERLRRAGFDLYSGVPCSYLTPLINTVIDSPRAAYVPAANEGEAVAVGAGAQLGGRRSVVMFQNSGLGNAVSPLTSLTTTFRLPVLILVTWRGQPGGPADEPQHEMMGHITPALLDLMQIPWETFPADESALGPALGRAADHMDRHGTPYALVLPKGCISALDTPRPVAGCVPKYEPHGEVEHASRHGGAARTDPDDALRAIQDAVGPTDAVLATTGFTGRALYALDDRPNQFYMVGSMGCVSSLGLGLALAQPQRRVVVLDGDGAMLMRMGALAAIGYQCPANLVHVLLDNGVHDSTGGQATLSAAVDFPAVARACGYSHVIQTTSASELADAVTTERHRLTFVYVRTSPRAQRKLPRPTVTPREVAARLRKWLTDHPAPGAGALPSPVGTVDRMEGPATAY